MEDKKVQTLRSSITDFSCSFSFISFEISSAFAYIDKKYIDLTKLSKDKVIAILLPSSDITNSICAAFSSNQYPEIK